MPKHTDDSSDDRSDHVWVVLGNSVEPVVYGLAALAPTTVTFIATDSTKALVRTVNDRLRGIGLDAVVPSPAKPVVVVPDDPWEIRKALDKLTREDQLPHGDLLFGGGTTVMNVVVAQVWSEYHAGSATEAKQWYLPARGSALLSTNGWEVTLVDKFADLDQLAAAASPRRRQWSMRSAERLRLTDPETIPVDSWASDTRVDAVSGLALALLNGRFDEGWKDSAWLEQLLGDAYDANDWKKPEKVSSKQFPSWRRGFALEVVTFALVARYLRQCIVEATLATEMALNLFVTEHSMRGDFDVTELDVVTRSGPRFTLFSCGVEGGTSKATFVRKMTEAERRARQFGGSEARSVLVWWRSPAPAGGKSGKKAGWNLPSDMNGAAAQSKYIAQSAGMDVDTSTNHTLLSLGEIFPKRNSAEVTRVLTNPTHASQRARDLLNRCLFP